jgi:hypothetical protein
MTPGKGQGLLIYANASILDPRIKPTLGNGVDAILGGGGGTF